MNFRRDLLMVIALLALITVLALPVLAYPMARDTGVFGVIAWGMLEGKPPFAGYWDFKPPGIYLVYAAAMGAFGRTPEALRAIDLLAFPLMGAAVYWLARRLTPPDAAHARRLAALALLLAGVFYFRESFWALTQNDGIALVPLLWAGVCALEARPAPRRGTGAMWAAGAGAALVAAMWFKYSFVLLLPALVAAYLSAPAARQSRRWLSDGTGFTLGALVVGLGGMAWLAALGVLDDLILSAQLVAPYAGLGYDGAAWHETPVWRAGVQERLDLWLPLLVGTAAALVAGGLRRRWAWVWAWGALMLVNVLIQAKGISYQWLPILPALALPSALTLDAGLRAAERRFPRALAGGLVAGSGVLLCAHLCTATWLPALPYLTGAQAQADYYARFQGGEFRADESLAMADYLRARVVPGDSLYIWGFRPEIYYLTGLKPATRFISQFPLVTTWYPPAWKDENVALLWAALPPYVLVLRGDDMPWVTGFAADSNVLLQSYTELNNWLIYNYAHETDIGGFMVWKRKDVPG